MAPGAPAELHLSRRLLLRAGIIALVTYDAERRTLVLRGYGSGEAP